VADGMRVAEMKPRITLREPSRTTHAIICEVAVKHNLTFDQIVSKSRRRPIAWARQEAFDRLYRETRASLPFIAEIFKMDHTTILYGIFAHRERKQQGKVI
jgi:chromosomal replication initiation ATPase DnaA